jgi:hypothetical protein
MLTHAVPRWGTPNAPHLSRAFLRLHEAAASAGPVPRSPTTNLSHGALLTNWSRGALPRTCPTEPPSQTDLAEPHHEPVQRTGPTEPFTVHQTSSASQPLEFP